MSKTKEVWVLGFALFAMFFGAGNLIFPPSLGVATGSNWFVASLGFLITGAGLPLLGVLAFTKCSSLDDFASKVSPRFNTLFCSVLILVIGPFFALPRTGSTTFELAVQPFFVNSGNILISIISSTLFFGVTYLLTVKESKVTDIIGKYLTPIILAMLAIIFVRGMTIDIGTPVETAQINNLFARGFIDGYQTMDALASILFGLVIVAGLKSKGVTEVKEQQYYLVRAGVIAAVGLGVIYLFLTYFGALVSGEALNNTTSPALYIAEATLGSMGRIIFGICVGAACLTTAVGLATLTADWFSKLLNVSYLKLLIVTCVFSTVVAIGGVDMIVKLSIPMLLLLYPLTIVLILMNLTSLKAIYFKLGTYTVLVVTLVEVIGSTFKVVPFTNLVTSIPLGGVGFPWLVPFVVSLGVAYLLDLTVYSKKAA